MLYSFSLRYDVLFQCRGDCKSPFKLGDYELAVRLLNCCKNDSLAMTFLNRIFYEFNGYSSPALAESKRVIEQVAWLVSSGRVHICGLGEITGTITSGGGAASSTAATQEEQPTSEETTAPRSSGPSQTPSSLRTTTSSPGVSSTTSATETTFSSQTDTAATADTLKAAAESGAPFCEECEKAKQHTATAQSDTAQSATPPQATASSQETTLPPAVSSKTDTTAMADTLTTAAESGTPFCEECEKAKQQTAAAQSETEQADSEQADSAQIDSTSQPAPSNQEANSTPSVSAKTDTIAMADTLTTAAESGTPFCEECEKAKQQAG